MRSAHFVAEVVLDQDSEADLNLTHVTPGDVLCWACYRKEVRFASAKSHFSEIFVPEYKYP